MKLKSIGGVPIVLCLTLIVSSCYEGETIIECDEHVRNVFELPDSVSSSLWYNGDFNSFSIINSRNDRITYNRSYGGIQRFFEQGNCDTIDKIEYLSGEFEAESIAPEWRMNAFLEPKLGRGRVAQLQLRIGDLASIVNLSDMTVSKLFVLDYFEDIDTFGGHFQNCYHLWRTDEETRMSQGMVFSIGSGILAYYLNDSIVWRRL